MIVPKLSLFFPVRGSGHPIVSRVPGTWSPTHPYRQGRDAAWILQRVIYVFIAIAGFAALALVIWYYRRRERSRRAKGKPVLYGRGGRRWLKWHDQHKSDTTAAGYSKDMPEDRSLVTTQHECVMPEKPRPTYENPARVGNYKRHPNPESMLKV
ncbi:uncharacterized protein JN550_006700 [Neoarthrinium moseri]|uniref:uncharacterized protein n=1 Tax=Neoarthrinium moseri TaxID=1658444 RepID=UPI001FDDC115|nr:uncharacterized protein JN550_006700 [Neoarthrinium moseri]KAI1867893.1 hypothetical protein JN550_006700 [Neoarthrinium moseri]